MLTATPEQLGVEGHFARLRLLDPDRYRDLATFQAEAKDYRNDADIAEKLLAGQELTKTDTALLRRLLAHEPDWRNVSPACAKATPKPDTRC